jgi:beta-lactamase regulating signal transducer with metallopeptidase domain
MMLTIAIEGSTTLLTQLANSAVRSVALAGIAGLALLAFRVKAASLRLFTWTGMLYVALALPLLGWVLPPFALPTPAFLQYGGARIMARNTHSRPVAVEPTTAAAEDASVAHNDVANRTLPPERISRRSSSSLQKSTHSSTAQPIKATPAASTSTLHPSLSIHWSVIATAIYLAVALLLFVRFVVGLVFSRRLMRSSRNIQEPRITVRLASRAHVYSLAFVPEVSESEFISVPVTMSVLRSKILLPTTWREWDDAKLDVVVAHEMSHVARRDTFTQCLSLLHRAIFWFSPLAWWLNRHLADLAEQASDEAALSCGAERNHYARTLLEFFEALQAAPGRVWWQGVSMAKTGQAEQRLERILTWRGAVTMRLKKPIAVAVIALAIPVVYLAASVRSGNSSQGSLHVEEAQDRTPPPAQYSAASPKAAPSTLVAPEAESEATPPPEPNAQAAPVPAPVAITGAIRDGISVVPVVARAPRAPIPAIIGVPASAPIYPPFAVSAQSAHSRSYGKGYSYSYGYDDDQRFVIASGKTDSLTMSGSTGDARHVEKLKKQISGDFIWFQRDEESYIIRDQATIDRARKLWAPQEELGKKQEALGKQQEALGKQQEALGARMEQVHVQVPDMTADLDKLRAKLKQLSTGATVEQVGDLQSEIGELQSKIGEIQSHAGDQQSKLGEEQGALGEKQGKLGEQQGELGRQQAELAQKATREMKVLLDEAITKGTAQPEVKMVKTPTL